MVRVTGHEDVHLAEHDPQRIHLSGGAAGADREPAWYLNSFAPTRVLA